MAESDNTVDPNDLDSIDALLDEAELESANVEDDAIDALSEEESWPEEASPAEASTDTDDLLDDLANDLAEAEPEPEPQALTENTGPGLLDVAAAGAAAAAVIPDSGRNEPSEDPMRDRNGTDAVMEDRAPSFIEKRSETPQPNNQLTVAEMDAIKKLIIIFSSVLIVLGLIGIIIGIWAAVSAGGGLDETTVTQLDNIESGTTQSLMKTNSLTKSMKSLEKKMDALSFQVEQLNNDLAKLESQKTALLTPSTSPSPAAPAAHQPANASSHETKGHASSEAQKPATASPAQPAAPVAPVMASMPIQTDPALALKLDKVSAQIKATQRHLSEVNRRVKSLQGQYKSMIKEFKTVEKHMMEVKISKVSETKTEKTDTKSSEGEYQYPPNGDPYYDSNIGTYP